MTVIKEALDRVQVHKRESDALQSMMESFTEEDWLRNSACDRWSVADVVAHVANGHAGRADSIGRGIRGEPPTEPAGYNMPAGGTARDQVIADRAIAVQKERQGNLAPYFKDTAQRLNEVLAGITPDVLENLCWHGRGIRTVRAYINLSIAEQAMHSWDIRSGFDPDAHINPEALPAFLDEAPRWWGVIFKAGPKLASPLRYRFRISGAASRTVDVVVDGDACRVEERVSAPSDVQFDCDAETYVLMAYGRIKSRQAVAQGLMAESEIEDSGHCAMFDSWF